MIGKFELTVERAATVRMLGNERALCKVSPASDNGSLYELKLLHNDGSYRTSVYNHDELEAIIEAIEAVLQ